MRQQQSGLRVNEKDLFDPIAQGMQQDDFCERFAGAQRFQSPLQALDRQAMFDGLIERLDHAAQGIGDGLANGRHHDRRDGIHDHMGLSPHGRPQRFGYMRGQDVCQVMITLSA
ncbi:MAG: hypothetical protein KIT40_02225 [Nitrospira sp.]|nr:hypothetical protein [Nitrospira sp.]